MRSSHRGRAKSAGDVIWRTIRRAALIFLPLAAAAIAVSYLLYTSQASAIRTIAEASEARIIDVARQRLVLSVAAAVADVFYESLRTHDVLSLAFSTALHDEPDASGGDIARHALEIDGADLRLDVDPSLGFPWGFFYTLPGYLQLARAGAAS